MAKKFQYNPPKNPPRQSIASPGSKPLDSAAQLSSSQTLSQQLTKNTAEKSRNGVSPGRSREQNGAVAAKTGHNPPEAPKKLVEKGLCVYFGTASDKKYSCRSI
jgi:hypothetical protein